MRDRLSGKSLIDSSTRMVKRKRAPCSNEWKHASLQSLCFFKTYLEHYQVECFNSYKISERCGAPRRPAKLKSAIMLPYFLPLPSLSRRPRVAEAFADGRSLWRRDVAEAQASCVVGLFPTSTFLLQLSSFLLLTSTLLFHYPRRINLSISIFNTQCVHTCRQSLDIHLLSRLIELSYLAAKLVKY